MNIIMVCESALVTGGAEKVAIQEAKELAKRGYRVGYIAANDSSDTELTNSGVQVLLLNTTSFFEENRKAKKLQKVFANWEIESEIQSFLSTFEPKHTVIHLHTFRLKLSGIVAHVAQKMGFASVVHCHDYSPVCPTSLLFDHRTGSNCDRKPMSLSCITCECQNQPWKYKLPKLSSYFWNQSVWKINQRSQGLLHISQLEKETINRASGSSKEGFSVSPISNFAADTRVKAEINQPFVFIGRITHEKGIESFLASATEASVSAVVIGDGPLRIKMEQEYPAARFTGWLSESEILDELKSARSVVVPSLWRETLCLSVIDAMIHGVPCIVSQNVGAQEFIQDGVSGAIFDEGKLAYCLEKFKDDKFVQSLSEQAFATFQVAPPTVERHVDLLIPIYEKCIKEVAREH